MRNNDAVGWAQACVTSIGFPDTIDEVLEMLNRNASAGTEITDIDSVLRFRSGDETFWTAPKWLTKGDILFFYHTKRGGLNASKLLNDARRLHPRKRRLIAVLEHAAELSRRFAGTIFGCAAVSGSTEYFGKQESHFSGRSFAPLGKVHIFGKPLKSESVADFVKIGQATITPLYTREAKGIRALLAAENRLPTFLLKLEFGDNTFQNVNRHNWDRISCLPDTRFIHEAQLRSYMLDYFLSAVKDKGTSLLEECQCFRDGESTGIVDNFVKIDGRWFPCEAKLNIRAEKDIVRQVRQYIGVDSFVPTRGPRRSQWFYPEKPRICLVVDQSGLYIVSSDGKYISCSRDKPLLRREAFGGVDSSGFRELIRDFI